MRFRVTGGADGVSGIEVANKRYEPGSEVDLTAKDAEWLVDQGYLEPADGSKKAVKAAAEPQVVEAPAPAKVASEDAGSEF